MRLVITGATGYVGAALLKHFHDSAAHHEILVALAPGNDDLSSIQGLPAGAIRCFRSGFGPAEPFPATGADALIHLAAETDATRSPTMQGRIKQANVELLGRVLETARKHDVKAIVFPSTLSIASPSSGVAREDLEPSDIQPKNPYSWSKRNGEAQIQEAARSWGMRFAILRMATVFGASPRLKFHTAVNRFVLSAILGEPLRVWRGAEEQVRPYLHLGDATRAIDHVLQETLKKSNSYNLRTEDASVRAVLSLIRQVVGTIDVKLEEPPFEVGPSFRTEMARLSDLGFQPSGSLRQGIEELAHSLAPVRQTPRTTSTYNSA